MIANNLYFFTAFYSFFIIGAIHLSWKKINKLQKGISSGAGYGLIILYTLIAHLNMHLDISFFYFFLFISTIYLIDDFRSLNFKLRIFLQILLGIIFFFLIENKNISENYFILLIIIFISFSLTNFINFNDGSDLNVSSMIIFYLIISLIFNHNINEFNQILIINTIIYLIIFSLFNMKKISYFGDSGCFIITGLILILIFDQINLKQIYFFIICFSYYLIDTTTFTIIRIKNKENLLSRNYYHLYQNLEKNYKGYYYLLPGLLNTLLLVLFFYYYNNFNFIIHDILIIIFVSCFYYYSMRFFFYK